MPLVSKLYAEENGAEWRDDDGNSGRGRYPIPGHAKRVKRFSINKADPRIASEMNRLGGVYRGVNGQSGMIARKKAIKFAQRKRFDLARRAQMVADSHKARVGKADEWSADLSVQPPPEYRGRRANYRSGTAKVGKRMTGAVAGVGSPKKVQPTRVAGRRTPGAGIPVRDMSQPPIEPSRIGKGLRARNAKAILTGRGRYVSPRFARNDAIHERLHTEHLRGFERAVNGHPAGAEVARTSRESTQANYGRPIGKRDRKHNPEHSRQRRLGITAAVTGLGGAALAVRGGRSIARDTRVMRDLADRSGHRVSTLTQPGAKVSMPIKYEHGNTRRHSHAVTADERAAVRNMARIPSKMVARPSRRQLTQIGGGATLIGASGTTVAYGRSRSNREWH